MAPGFMNATYTHTRTHTRAQHAKATVRHVQQDGDGFEFMYLRVYLNLTYDIIIAAILAFIPVSALKLINSI